MRFLRAGIAVLAVLALLAGTAAFYAFGQRDAAQTQARIATSRQLAATARSEITSRLDLARLLARRGVVRGPRPLSVNDQGLKRSASAPRTTSATAWASKLTEILVDAGPLIAGFDDSDVWHDECSRLLETLPGPLIVPATILARSAT